MSTHIEDFITEFGLIAIALGTFLEGETAAIAGGVLANYGVMPLWQAAAAAFAGAFIADFGIFLFARRFRDHPWVQRQLARPALARPLARVNKSPYGLAAVYRFIPGMRIIAPIVLAQSTISTLRFGCILAMAAAVWSLAYVVFGVAIGTFLARIFGQLSGAAPIIAAGAAVLGASAAVGYVVRKRRRMVTASASVLVKDD